MNIPYRIIGGSEGRGYKSLSAGRFAIYGYYPHPSCSRELRAFGNSVVGRLPVPGRFRAKDDYHAEEYREMDAAYF